MISIVNPPYSGGGGGGDEDVVAVSFSFATPSPLILAQLTPGQILDRACVVIQAGFNGADPSIELGVSGVAGRVLSAGEIDAKTPGQYESDELLIVDVPDFLILTILPSASTVGDGLLFYKLKK